MPSHQATSHRAPPTEVGGEGTPPPKAGASTSTLQAYVNHLEARLRGTGDKATHPRSTRERLMAGESGSAPPGRGKTVAVSTLLPSRRASTPVRRVTAHGTAPAMHRPQFFASLSHHPSICQALHQQRRLPPCPGSRPRARPSRTPHLPRGRAVAA